ncbi:neurotrypsin-like [Mercenaria mercenaria]|uniref:neurotrypsin-like n=1 Tax=Mercenaria mercenaria TaxID=6596 RepID=UPI00234ECBAE|nr:neurotrypsin-like [Mercenaria mercenaria]
MDNIRKNILALGLVILVVEYTFVICDGIRWTKYHYNGNTGHKHVEPREKVFTAEVKDPVACAKLCHTNGVCKSFSFQAETNKCSGCKGTLHCDAVATDNPQDSATSAFFSTVKEHSGPSSVRLAGGHIEYEGRLEVFQNGQWGAVCNDSFGKKEAMVACKMLNLQWDFAKTYPSAHFNESTLPILLGDVSCSGSENSLFECLHRVWGEVDCRHGENVGISCSPVSSVRFGQRSFNWSGALEVLHNKHWAPVCADNVDTEKAMVVCNMLNLTWVGVRTFDSPADSKDTATIRMDDFTCTGSERSLSECPHYSVGESDCSLGFTVIITCAPIFHIRLADAESLRKGRVQVSYDGKMWYSMCGYGFDKNAAEVSCRMLGYETSSPYFDAVDDYDGEAFFASIICKGSEDSLLLCTFHHMDHCDNRKVFTVECP